MAWITDSLRSAIAAVNPFAQRANVTALPGVLNHQLAYAAYQASGMLQKVIDIPAADRVREWRDWQAEKEQIEAIEAEERRLGLIAKVKQAEVLRGIGGGALILAAPGSPDQPIGAVSRGELTAVNVVSRWQLQGADWVKELTDPLYGTPRMWRITGDGQQRRIHPSRVIPFRGDTPPAGIALGDEEAFWGMSRLARVMREVENSDATQRWFAELVKKAKLLRIGIPNLPEMLATSGGQAKLDARVRTIAEGEGVLNATVFSAAGGGDAPGETITDYQVQWTGIPAMMDAFDQRVAAVADIPFTRLMGRSPAGMNATGEYDDQNWHKTVAAGQSLELRPCLEALDPVLLASAGVSADKVTWRFAPLSKPSEKQEADTFKTVMEAVTALQNTGAIPDVAFAKGVQNLMAEREYIPGLDQALAELPEDERFGLNPAPDDTDPSALTEGGDPASSDLAGDESAGRRRAPVSREVDDKSGLPFGDAQGRHPAGSRRGGQFAPKGVGGFSGAVGGKPPANASAIQQATGLSTGHLSRTGRAQDLNHASRYSKSGRNPPSQAVLKSYPAHAASAHAFRLQGSRESGSGLRLRSEITIGTRSYTLIERVGERSATLSFVTMWENV